MKPILMVLLVCALVSGTVARAQGGAAIASSRETIQPSTTKGPYYAQSDAELRMRKLARGCANMLLCPAEIPNQMFQEAYKTSPVTGVVVGFFKGIAKGAVRLAVGAWEVATFYFPGNNNYQPIVDPEVVFQEYLH